MDDGGPAFPRAAGEVGRGDSHEAHGEQDGMSLRDYFAASALQLLGLPSYEGMHMAELAQKAYQLADWMLTERAKTR